MVAIDCVVGYCLPLGLCTNFMFYKFRSSVRLRSAGSGHTDLQLVISEIKEMRAAARWFQSSQTSAIGDLLKWSLRGENRAIQETAAQLVELNMIWSDAQKNFTGLLQTSSI